MYNIHTHTHTSLHTFTQANFCLGFLLPNVAIVLSYVYALRSFAWLSNIAISCSRDCNVCFECSWFCGRNSRIAECLRLGFVYLILLTRLFSFYRFYAVNVIVASAIPNKDCILKPFYCSDILMPLLPKIN